MKVVLQVYDLSQGIAKAMAPMLVGQNIEAIYHTGVAVDETEYYYSAGIQSDIAGQTHFGTPIKQLNMGETTKTTSEINTFLDNIRPRYTEANYNLIEHNCNHFSNEFLQFLCNANVPDNIINQGAEFLTTPLGRLVAPMLQNNVLGIPGATTPASRVNLSPKTREKSSIAIEKPIVFIAKEVELNAARDKILAKFGSVGKLDEGSNFQVEFTNVIRAVINKTFYAINSSVISSVCDLFSFDASSFAFDDAFLDFFASICLTTDQQSITDNCVPLRFIEHYENLPTDAFEPFCRYIHNWFVQLRGMRDFRDNSSKYLNFIVTKLVESERPLQKLYGHRLLFTSSRIFTKQMTVDNYEFLCGRLIAILLAAVEKAKTGDDSTRKSQTQIANLTAGALGRLILTADDRDTVNGWYMTTANALSGVNLHALGAPCCSDLYEHVSSDDDRGELY